MEYDIVEKRKDGVDSTYYGAGKVTEQGGLCRPQAGRRGPCRGPHTISSRVTKIVRVAENAGWESAPVSTLPHAEPV